jgi:hypothetical protein
MENKFSLNRIGLLLRRHFVENSRQEVMYWVVILFIFTVMDQRNFVITVLFISGLIYSTRLHKALLKGSNGIQYLLIPATLSEKLTVSFLLSTVYHFGMTLLAYSIGNLLVTLVYQVLLKIQVPVNWDLFVSSKTLLVNGIPQLLTQNEFWLILGYFSLSQSIFMLGALSFRTQTFVKTLLVTLGVVLFLSGIQLILFKSLWSVRYLSNAILPIIIMLDEFTIPDILLIFINIASYIFLPFFWLVSYLKLKERQA